MIATCFALISFAAALGVGVRAGNDTLTILWRALILMAAAWGIGFVVGTIAMRTVEEHLSLYRAEHPISDDPQMGTDAVFDAASDDEVTAESLLQPEGAEAPPRAG